MSALSRTEVGQTESVFQVEGVFDVRAAKRVVEYVEAVGRQKAVRVDLSKVTEFHDFGVALLAQALKQTRLVRVRVVGLRTHQLRVMRYFGLDVGHLPRA